MIAEPVGEYIEWGAQGDAVVEAHSVVPVQPLEQALVERVNVTEQQFRVVIDKLVLDGVVEALAMGVRFCLELSGSAGEFHLLKWLPNG